MVDETRRKILKSGAAAAAMAAVSPALAQQNKNNQAMPAGKFYEKGKVRIHYQEWGSGFPLMLISGGGLGGSKIDGLTNPFDAVAEFKGEYRCIAADLRTSTGQSSGPLEIDRPWEMFADDQISLYGSPGHRPVHGDGLLHRRPTHLEPPQARPHTHRRRSARAAERLPRGGADADVRHEHAGLGTGLRQAAS